jgi:multidrug efflux pump subunit AcrA (membrane-fusion protein)
MLLSTINNAGAKILLRLAAAACILLTAFVFVACGDKDAKAAGDATAATKSDSAESAEDKRVRAEDIKKITALGRIEPEGQITPLSMEVSGVVAKIMATDGQELSYGETILELDHSVESARLQLAEARARTQSEEVKSAMASVRVAEIKARNYKERYERLANIFESGAETRQNLDNAKADYETAQRDAERLQASLKAAESRLNELQADARVIRAEIGRKILKAPSDGKLLKLTPNVGSAVVGQNPVGDFAPKGATTALCEVDELFVDAVALGQKAFIRRQGAAETIATGTVVAVGAYLKKKSLFSDEAGALEDRRVREVRVRLDETAKPILLNSRVECVIAVK